VSNINQRLENEARRLESLHEDVHVLAFDGQTWRGEVLAPRALGEGVPVEAWYLAEHFLLTWHDWHVLRERVRLQTTGQHPGQPAKWNDLDSRSQQLASRLLQDAGLDKIIAASWLPELNAGMEELSVRSLYRAIVTNHRRITLLVPVEARTRFLGNLPRPASLGGLKWQQSHDITLRLNRRLIARWPRLSETDREDTLWHLQQYQTANLLNPMLPDATHQAPQSALIFVLTEKRVPPIQADHVTTSNRRIARLVGTTQGSGKVHLLIKLHDFFPRTIYIFNLLTGEMDQIARPSEEEWEKYSTAGIEIPHPDHLSLNDVDEWLDHAKGQATRLGLTVAE
jgi:hypothetical protein